MIQDKTTKVFSSPMASQEWWEDFLINTENRSKTTVIKQAFTLEDADLLSQEILQVISELCKLRTDKYGYRVFVDDKPAREDMLNYIFDNPPSQEEDVEQYAARVFDDKNFGMIINGCEKFSDSLSKKILELIHPLLKIVGIPMSGLSIHTFVGNYGYTPLGIHKDNPGENVIHFHLGPGGKTMYNWSDDVYEQIDGKKKNSNKAYEQLIAHADEYRFEKGDIYFMPWNKFHLGKTEGLSIGVTLWFNNPPKKALYDKIFSSLTKQYMISDDRLNQIVSPVKDPYGQETLKEMEDLLNLDEDFNFLPFKEVFKILHDDYKLALFSNSGWKTRTISLSDEDLFNVSDYAFLRDKSVRAVSPFKIFFRTSIDDQDLIIFARGTKLKIRYHPEVENILDKINTGSTFTSNELLKNLISAWPEAAGLYILALLYDKRAIEII